MREGVWRCVVRECVEVVFSMGGCVECGRVCRGGV